MAALYQLKKIFNLLENYLKNLACSQVSDRCPLGYLFRFLNYFSGVFGKNSTLIWSFIGVGIFLVIVIIVLVVMRLNRML